MKKVAIITIWDLINYGNRLQNYAVTVIAQKRGLDPETIIVDKSKALGKRTTVRDMSYFLKFLVSNGKKTRWGARCKFFDDFSVKNIPSREIDNIDDWNRYDYAFIGSDQIWNAEIIEPLPYVYGQMFTPEKVLCVSPSFGIDGFGSDIEEVISGYLNRLEHISVREHSGAEIVKRLTGKEVPVFIDPTLMLTSNEWKKVERKPLRMTKKKYILKYFLGKESESSICDTEQLVNEYGYEVIKLLEPNNPWMYVSGPAEFIYLIHHAEAILTDSFHACVFSILFKKPFWVYERTGERMNSRMTTLFSLLEIDNRFIHDNNLFNVDYSKVDNCLENEKKKVNLFLDTILVK